MSTESHSDIFESGDPFKLVLGLQKVSKNGWIIGSVGQNCILELHCRITTSREALHCEGVISVCTVEN